MEEKRSHIAVKLLKGITVTLLVFVIAGIALRLSLKTEVVASFVKQKIVESANETLNGDLQIRTLKGDLWKRIEIHDIAFSQEDTLLQVDTLGISYNLLSYFFSPRFQINELNISGAKAAFERYQSGETNFSDVLPADTTEEDSGFYFELENIQLSNARFQVKAPGLIPDSILVLDDISLSGSASFDGNISATVSSLEFLLEEGRLPKPVSIKSRASYSSEVISLEQLVINTGRSLVEANALAELEDESIKAEIQGSPVSLKDIEPYVDYDLLEESIQLSVSVDGRLDSLNVEINANSPALRNVTIVSNIDVNAEPVLHSFGITGDYLNLTELTRDSIDAEVQLFRASVTGKVNKDYKEIDIVWGFDFSKLRYQDYRFDRIFGSGVLNEKMFTGHLDLTSGLGDHLVITVSGNETFSEFPTWIASAGVRDLNVSHWMEENAISTSLGFTIGASGTGFKPHKEGWEYKIESRKEISVSNGELHRKPVTSIILNDQSFHQLFLSGTISDSMITSKGFFEIKESRLNIDAGVSNYLSMKPEFDIEFFANRFDLSEINQLSDFPTSLNFKGSASGSGISKEDLSTKGDFLMDSSIVNGSRVRSLQGNFDYKNGILSIPEGKLNAEIAEGSFRGRKNMLDPSDPDNNLVADLLLKDVQPLAPLLNAEIFRSSGQLQAIVTENENGVLQYDAELDLYDIQVDDKLNSERITGYAKVTVTDSSIFDINVDIAKPLIKEITLQDITFKTTGTDYGTYLKGQYELDIEGSERGRITQEGSYQINKEEDSGTVKINRFDFITPGRTLGLNRPFNTSFSGYSISTDTLSLSSNEGAYFNLYIPEADTSSQQLWFSGDNFNFGILQEVLFDEVYIDGILSGEMTVSNSRDSLQTEGALTIANLNYKGVDTDGLEVNFSIKDEYLKMNGNVQWDGEERITGNLEVPFVLKQPAELGDKFFAREVKGNLTIRPTELNRFQALLNTFEISKTEGTLSFEGNLSGQAGEPNFEGNLVLRDPVLSGIATDSAFANFSYDHQNEVLSISSEIIAQKQKAASINAQVPVTYDFKNMKLNTPEEGDNIKASIITEGFNLAVLNDFLDKEYLANLKGKVNADLLLEGRIGALRPAGFITMNGGEIRVPVAGIKLENVKSDMEFTDQGLSVKEFSAKSGKGTAKIDGLISFEGIKPGTLNLKTKATQFMLANTDDYNIVIDLNGEFTGRALKPKATGEISIRNGFVYLQNFGEKAIEDVQLEGEGESSFSLYDSLAIEMEVKLERNFFVRNRRYLDMEIELDGKLDVQKERNGELFVFGTLEGENGYLRPLGKRFDLEESDLLFDGPIDNPTLSVKASYIPPTAQKEGEPIILYYIIEGTAENPEFRFESNPPMEQQDIIAYTLFGRPFYALDSWQQTLSGTGSTNPSDILVDVLLDEVEALATRELGIDVVQIDNTRVGSESGTSIKTGWYLNERTFFAILNEITKSNPRTLFILEYLLSKNTDLIITQGNDNRQGIDIRWRFDY